MKLIVALTLTFLASTASAQMAQQRSSAMSQTNVQRPLQQDTQQRLIDLEAQVRAVTDKLADEERQHRKAMGTK